MPIVADQGEKIKMVDFNNDVTVGTPAVDIVRVLILQRRNDVIEAFEHYYKQEEVGYDQEVAPIRARLKSLFLEIAAMITRHEGKGAGPEIWKSIESGEVDELLDVFIRLNFLLDDVKLTRIDLKKKLGGDLRVRNKAQGWKA